MALFDEGAIAGAARTGIIRIPVRRHGGAAKGDFHDREGCVGIFSPAPRKPHLGTEAAPGFPEVPILTLQTRGGIARTVYPRDRISDRLGAQARPLPCAGGVVDVGRRISAAPPEKYFFISRIGGQFRGIGVVADRIRLPRDEHKIADLSRAQIRRDEEGKRKTKEAEPRG